MTWDDEHV